MKIQTSTKLVYKNSITSLSIKQKPINEHKQQAFQTITKNKKQIKAKNSVAYQKFV